MQALGSICVARMDHKVIKIKEALEVVGRGIGLGENSERSNAGFQRTVERSHLARGVQPIFGDPNEVIIIGELMTNTTPVSYLDASEQG